MRFAKTHARKVGIGVKYASLLTLAFALSLFLPKVKTHEGGSGWYSDLHFSTPHAEADVTTAGCGSGGGSCSSTGGCPDAPDGGGPGDPGDGGGCGCGCDGV